MAEWLKYLTVKLPDGKLAANVTERPVVLPPRRNTRSARTASRPFKFLGQSLVWAVLISLAYACLMMTMRYKGATSQVAHLQSQQSAVELKIAKQQHQMTREFAKAAVLHSAIVQLTSQLRAEKQQVASLSSRHESIYDLAASPWTPFVATWYSSRGGVGDGKVTAAGTLVRDNWTVAVDPSVIPLGSLIEIRFPDGTSQMCQALDTGRAIHGRRIDIFNHSDAACRTNGIEAVQVRVLLQGVPVSIMNHG